MLTILLFDGVYNSALFSARHIHGPSARDESLGQDLSFSTGDSSAGPAGHDVTLLGMLAVPASHEAAQPRVLLSLHS